MQLVRTFFVNLYPFYKNKVTLLAEISFQESGVAKKKFLNVFLGVLLRVRRRLQRVHHQEDRV
jgi:hypothetical protein